MKTKLMMGLLLAGVFSVQATLFTAAPGAAIPDNNPSGYVSTIAVSGLETLLSSVNVQLNLSGGYNGDLYAYVTYDGQLVTLLNRVGTGGGNTYGYADAGLNITLSDSGTANGNIHNYQTVGGYAGLISGGGVFLPDSGGVTFGGAYQYLNPNGTWALFIADLSAGSQSTLVSWSLDITAVPEPVNLALGMFAGLLALWCWLGRWWTRTTPKI